MLLLFLFCEWCGRGEARRGEAKWTELLQSPARRCIRWHILKERAPLSQCSVRETLAPLRPVFILFFYFFMFHFFSLFFESTEESPHLFRTGIRPGLLAWNGREKDETRTRRRKSLEKNFRSKFVCLSVCSFVRPSVRSVWPGGWPHF